MEVSNNIYHFSFECNYASSLNRAVLNGKRGETMGSISWRMELLMVQSLFDASGFWPATSLWKNKLWGKLKATALSPPLSLSLKLFVVSSWKFCPHLTVNACNGVLVGNKSAVDDLWHKVAHQMGACRKTDVVNPVKCRSIQSKWRRRLEVNDVEVKQRLDICRRMTSDFSFKKRKKNILFFSFLFLFFFFLLLCFV